MYEHHFSDILAVSVFFLQSTNWNSSLVFDMIQTFCLGQLLSLNEKNVFKFVLECNNKSPMHENHQLLSVTCTFEDYTHFLFSKKYDFNFSIHVTCFR